METDLPFGEQIYNGQYVVGDTMLSLHSTEQVVVQVSQWRQLPKQLIYHQYGDRCTF